MLELVKTDLEDEFGEAPQKIKKGPGRRKKVYFKPSRQFIHDRVQDYLKNGGRITKIIIEETPDLIA